MKVLLVSKACLVGIYQRKLEEIAAHTDIDLTVAVPARWKDERGVIHLERAHTDGYELVVETLLFNGNYHLHFYPKLVKLIRQHQPDIVHIDEEPYNFATWHAMRLAKNVGARTLFFSWQNIARQYPWPFKDMESAVLAGVDAAICGNQDAATVWQQKGYKGPTAVIPQFGVDPVLFPWREPAPDPAQRFVVGYIGRLVYEKGVDLLLEAFARLPEHTQLEIIGSGPQQRNLERQINDLGLFKRVRFTPWSPSHALPARLQALDVLVLPSRSLARWKEQFGRVLIEAMASGVPVVGSTCGEIPNVIDTAGRVFPEGDAAALATILAELFASPENLKNLAERGRARMLEHFTQARIATETVAVYRRMMQIAPMV